MTNAPRVARPIHTLASLCAMAALSLTLTACGGDTDPEVVSTPLVPESTPAGSLGPAPSPAVNVESKGLSSAECVTMQSVLTNAGAIAMKADGGLVEQSDVDRAFSADATSGVAADAMVYVDAAKTVAQDFVGKDATGAVEVLKSWQTVYADLTAATLRTCS